MKKLENLGRILSKLEQKSILGGVLPIDDNACNAYCGVGSGQSCDSVCPHCVDAGNGSGTKPGQDKLCVR